MICWLALSRDGYLLHSILLCAGDVYFMASWCCMVYLSLLFRTVGSWWCCLRWVDWGFGLIFYGDTSDKCYSVFLFKFSQSS